MPAWRAKAAPTTRRRIARRLDESRKAMARIAAMPARLIKARFIYSPSPDHPLLAPARRLRELVERPFYRVDDDQLLAPRLRHEAAPGRVVKEVDETVPETRHVEQCERLGVVAQCVPRPGLEQFVERADAAGKGDEGVAQIRHLRFA